MAKSFKVQLAEIIRDSTHNLIIHESNELDNKTYFSRVECFIGALEGSTNGAYLDGIVDPKDSKKFISAAKFYSLSEEEQEKLRDTCVKKNGTRKNPVTTVGIGANLEIEGILDKFDKVLGQPGLMQQVYKGKADLTNDQVSIIFKDCISVRLDELHKAYGSDWKKLRVNEQITILSLYFNLPGLAGPSTNFYKHIKNYVNTNSEIHLKRAVDEVVKKSNREKVDGIQNRREAEGALLASYLSPTYTKPCQLPDDAKIKVAKLDKTIIPLNNDSHINDINSEYFIWRTKMDAKVRKEHMLHEGKIFRRSHPPKGCMPGSMHNCRCHDEKVPDHILINDEIAKNKAFTLYLRKGIKHPILFLK